MHNNINKFLWWCLLRFYSPSQPFLLYVYFFWMFLLVWIRMMTLSWQIFCTAYKLERRFCFYHGKDTIVMGIIGEEWFRSNSHTGYSLLYHTILVIQLTSRPHYYFCKLLLMSDVSEGFACIYYVGYGVWRAILLVYIWFNWICV